MLSFFIFALIFSAVSTQEISCPDLLDSLLACAGNEIPSEEIVAIPVTCIEEVGATVKDLTACGLLDIPPALETETVEGEESEPVTLTIGEETPEEQPMAPAPFVIIYVPAPIVVPATPTPTPTPIQTPPVYAVAAASASAIVSGGSASADAAAVATIIS